MHSRIGFSLLAGLLSISLLSADEQTGFKQGKVGLESIGPIAFGTEGVLFVSDPKAATIFAVQTREQTAPSGDRTIKIEGVNGKIANLLGAEAKQIQIVDMAVNPETTSIYFSVTRGRGPNATPVVVRLTSNNKLEEFALDNVSFTQAKLPNPPQPAETKRGNPRMESITDISFIDDKVVVAGLSNEEFASKLRILPFPFITKVDGTSVEIYHGSHGRFETNAPIRTFTALAIGGQPHLLAAYTCTPLVKFPLAELKPNAKIQGTTVAELGNRNRPLDMFVYEKGGKSFVLLANSDHGVMKIPTEGLDKAGPLTERVRGVAGHPFEKVQGWEGIVQLDRFNNSMAVVLAAAGSDNFNLETRALP